MIFPIKKIFTFKELWKWNFNDQNFILSSHKIN